MDPTNNTTSAAASRRDPSRPPRAEAIVAAGLFVIAFAIFLAVAARLASPPAGGVAQVPPGGDVPALALFVLLAGAYLALTVGVVRWRVARALSSGVVGPFVPPAVLLGAVAAYCALAQLAPMPRLAIYAAYLFLPVAVVLPRARVAVPALVVAAMLWLPLEFHLVPVLPLPAVQGGFDASHLVGLANGLGLFLVTRPLGGIGFTFMLSRRDVARACLAFSIFAIVALPIGLGTRFLRWNPRLTAEILAVIPWLIYLGTAIPEEFLFRGVIQNACARLFGPLPSLAIASVVFGLAHLPDWRYVLLATFAGVAYGWVYWRTGKVTASAITHALVDSVWVLLLRV